jgi:hypothetical protein
MWGIGQAERPGFIGFLARGCCSVLLSLFPVSFPERVFVASLPSYAGDPLGPMTLAERTDEIGRMDT